MKSKQVLFFSLFFAPIVLSMNKRKDSYGEYIGSDKGKKKRAKSTATHTSKHISDSPEQVKKNKNEEVKHTIAGKLAYCIIGCCSNVDSSED